MKPRHVVEKLSEANNVWFGSFDVGNSKNLTLLIDTGSSDVIVSPGLYKGGPHSVDTSSTFANTYGTTESDGSEPEQSGAVYGRFEHHLYYSGVGTLCRHCSQWKDLKKDALAELDTGTATVIGPLDDVIAIFKAASIRYVIQISEDSGTSVTGYFPCDRPPTLELSIPSQSNATAAAKQNSKLVSHHSSTFNIAPDQWIAADNRSNNCTAILSGTDAFPIPDLWVVGQPFFHGTYVDHNLKDGTLGFAPARCTN
ncbi:acid protease [Penicillium subrubescens]|uniref:acid protease n=1 Tax=Penicillium subrubescens TaxID=1316194 RepID=UPI00254582A1|nr:acid protease [Penicillium subrubescens]KAJ5900940.1 acid protease [Penicillium subrubescens]